MRWKVLVVQMGIIGAGGIGQAFARQLARVGYDTVISNSRGPDTLRDLARQLGPCVRAGTVQAAAQADIVMLAVTWKALPGALAGLSPWEGRILIDATNPIIPPGFSIADLGGRTSSEVVADLCRARAWSRRSTR